MGMYDEFKCEIDIPGYEYLKGMYFQTKDFNCLMDDYRIDSNGRLLREVVHYEDKSDPTKIGWERLIGSISKVHEGWEDTNFHGILYGIGDKETDGEYYRYTFKFTDGKFTGEVTKGKF